MGGVTVGLYRIKSPALPNPFRVIVIDKKVNCSRDALATKLINYDRRVQRAVAALRAISARRLALTLSARAFPPFRPSSAAALSLSPAVLSSSSSRWPVAISMTSDGVADHVSGALLSFGPLGMGYAIQCWPVVPRISLILRSAFPASASAFANTCESIPCTRMAVMARSVAAIYSDQRRFSSAPSSGVITGLAMAQYSCPKADEPRPFQTEALPEFKLTHYPISFCYGPGLPYHGPSVFRLPCPTRARRGSAS